MKLYATISKKGYIIYDRIIEFILVDVTNRDGVQTSRLGLAKLQKTIINLMLDKRE